MVGFRESTQFSDLNIQISEDNSELSIKSREICGFLGNDNQVVSKLGLLDDYLETDVMTMYNEEALNRENIENLENF